MRASYVKITYPLIFITSYSYNEGDKMLFNVEKIIIDLAKNAVLVAEEELGSGTGKQKKEMAIKYIVSNLPFSSMTQSLIAIFLSRFIDSAVEISVKYMNSLPKEQGE